MTLPELADHHALPERVPKWWPHQDEFPDWRVWQGENLLYYARFPGTDPLVIVHGENVEDLRDEIIRMQSETSGHEG